MKDKLVVVILYPMLPNAMPLKSMDKYKESIGYN
jgi:hypothetical protein